MEREIEKIYIRRILEGDIEVFSLLVSKYQNLVFTICSRVFDNKEEAEDIAQESFIKCYQSLKQFKGESKFSSWLYTITYNTCMNHLKYKKRQTSVEDIANVADQDIIEQDHIFAKLEQKEQTNLIQQALSKLELDEQMIIQLYYYEELPIKEISNILSLKIENVKIKLFRSRKKLFTNLSLHSQFSTLIYE
ncbi:MAG: sigma-70 family RNA polymerase sigma factor [Saprospiraceae bacterium]|uniref:Sigma-70 family RNA polymerase sigma factor n=1 Tax=Candidatus Defluviibacterium haderslevense TaxID=2981993 RepID=A0A9D7SA59_9BACT|nr:sigma-70 family RNA polymerase sigma factor [Candidatus Defluviibacterium haderslevense]MBL0236705.1 sigma-70 family RNA polymerase sigma factor [Candidatus Defluviibacterium haderslevense]